MSQAVDIIFYDGIVSKPYRAQISAQSKTEVLIRYGEQLEQQRHYQYTDMKLIGALG
ncbi:peptidase, partial [Acinetobacter baumannii]|nr:peptidase [Acinetobacter baumannii]